MPDKAPHPTTTTSPLLLGDAARLSLIVSIAASAVGSLALWLTHGSAAGTLCMVAGAALVATSIPLATRPRLSVAEPLWFVILSVAIGVTGKAFYLFLGTPARITFLLGDRAPADLIPAAIVVTVAMLCFAFGYMLGDFGVRFPLPARLRTDDWPERRVFFVGGVFVVAAVVCLALLIPRIDTSTAGWNMISGKRFVRVPGSAHLSPGGYLRWGASLGISAFLLLFTHWVASRKAASRILTAAVLGTGLLAVMSTVFFNSRRDLLFLMFALLLIWTCVRGEPRAGWAIGTGAITLALGSAMLLVRAIANPAITAARLRTGVILESTIAGRHFLDLTKTALILEAYPERFDFLWGGTFFRWVVAPIPRSLWPTKPPISVAKELGPALFDTAATTGVPPGIIGELHMNFGRPGIFLGMVVVGALLRTLYAGTAYGFPRRSFALLYAVAAPHVAFGAVSIDVSGTIVALFQDLIPIVAAIAICGEPGTTVEPESPDGDLHRSARQFDTATH